MEAKDVFEEWDSYAKRQTLRDREIDFGGIIRNAERKIVAVTGIRRSGKSSVLMLLAQRLAASGKKVCYINLEDSRFAKGTAILDEAIKWFGDSGTMLLDEVTSAQDWEGWLARTHDQLKGRLKVIVSSSRRTLLVPSRPLRGRILPYELYPLSFREFLSFKGVETEKTTAGRGKIEKAFTEYVKYGGFPEVALTKEEVDKVRILHSYFRDIVGLDIAEVSVEDLAAVEVFGKYVLGCSYFSASKCLGFLKGLGHKISKAKILQLEHFSQASYLFFFVGIFSHNLKDKSQYPRKAYGGDVGFRFATTGKLDIGRVWENLVLLELKRRAQGQKEISYWKNKLGMETDFVVRQGTQALEVIQVVYEMGDEKTSERELKGLVACANELKPKKAIVLTGERAETRTVGGVRIHTHAILDWLLEEATR